MFPLNRLSILLKPGFSGICIRIRDLNFVRYRIKSRRQRCYYRLTIRGPHGKRRHHHPDSRRPNEPVF